MPQKTDFIDFQGGLDIVSPYQRIPKGSVIACQNYESEVRGYRRMAGYERYDGQPKPSAATYHVLSFDSGSVAMSEDDVVTGDTSSATGIVLADATIESGTYGGGDAAGYVVLYNVSGVFQDDEGLEVSASNVATADGAAIQGGAGNDTDDSTWTRAIMEKRRDVIAAVPGSGGILGIFTYMGDVYAIRNNVGGTAAVMHKATAAGWSAQTFGRIIDFDSGGTTAIAEGDTIEGAGGGATAIVERVVIQSGAWGTGDAAGYLVLSGQTGTFGAENLDVGAATNIATVAGDSSAITLPPGGLYRWVVHNFYGLSNLRRVYLVDQVGYAMEWDGSVLVPIKTGAGASIDKPQHIAVHNNHLLLGYDGGAVQFSSTGIPTEFNATGGAGEFGLGQKITGMVSSTKTATIIACQNKVSFLTGNDSTDFEILDIAPDSGAVPDTLAVIGEPYFLDDRGVRSLTAAQEFGDWSIGTVTRLIEPIIAGKRRAGTAVVGAHRVRAKDQYRLYYEDGSVISIYFGRSSPECMTMQVEFTPTRVCDGDDASNNEIVFCGGDDGFVYQMDSGNSADGEGVEAFIRTPFLFQKSPITDKKYWRATLGIEGGSVDTELSYSSDYTFGSPDSPSGVSADVTVSGAGGFWDAALWDEFYWSAANIDQPFAELNGIGRNVSIAISSSSTYQDPHTLSSLTINYDTRRSAR